MSQLISSTAASQAEQDFQEKMKERMRQAFGDLMPDAVLAGIVARGMEEAFFKDVVIKARDSWGRDEVRPSWLVQFVQKEAEKQVKEAVEKWVKEHPEKFAEVVREVLDKGLASACVKAFDNILFNEMQALQRGIGDAIQRLRGS